MKKIAYFLSLFCFVVMSSTSAYAMALYDIGGHDEPYPQNEAAPYLIAQGIDITAEPGGFTYTGKIGFTGIDDISEINLGGTYSWFYDIDIWTYYEDSNGVVQWDLDTPVADISYSGSMEANNPVPNPNGYPIFYSDNLDIPGDFNLTLDGDNGAYLKLKYQDPGGAYSWNFGWDTSLGLSGYGLVDSLKKVSVPEPSTFFLLGISLLGLVGSNSFRKKRKT